VSNDAYVISKFFGGFARVYIVLVATAYFDGSENPPIL
jgi:hypothetical protein